MSVSADEMLRRQSASRALVPYTPPTVVPTLASTSMQPYTPAPPRIAPTSLVQQPGMGPTTGGALVPQQTAAQRLAAAAPAPAAPAAPAGPTIAVGNNGTASIGGVQPRAPERPPPRPTMYANASGVVSPVPPRPDGTRLPPGVTGPFDPTPTRAAAARGAVPPPAAGAAPSAAPAGAAPSAAPAGAVPGAAPAPAGAVANAAARAQSFRPGVGGKLAIGYEGLNVAGAAAEGGAGAALQEGAGAVGRLGAAQLGATAASRLASAVPLPGRFGTALRAAAPIIGGVGGYSAGADGVDRIERALTGRPSPEQAAQGRGAAQVVTDANGQQLTVLPGVVPRLEARGNFDAVRAGSSVYTPPPAAGDDAARVLGTFTGSDGRTRNITAGEADRLSSQLNTVPAGQAPTAAQRLAAPVVRGVSGSIESERARYVQQLDRQIQNIGPLDRRSRRQMVTELLGLKGRSIEGAAGLSARADETGATLASRAAADQLSADVNREQIEASTANQRRQNTQLVAGADGTTYAVEGTTLTPLTTGDGETFRQATKLDDSQQKLAADILASITMPGATPEQMAANVEQARNAAAALAAPPGAGAAAPTKAQFIEAAKARNPGATDAQLGAYYDQTYGK